MQIKNIPSTKTKSNESNGVPPELVNPNLAHTANPVDRETSRETTHESGDSVNDTPTLRETSEIPEMTNLHISPSASSESESESDSDVEGFCNINIQHHHHHPRHSNGEGKGKHPKAKFHDKGKHHGKARYHGHHGGPHHHHGHPHHFHHAHGPGHHAHPFFAGPRLASETSDSESDVDHSSPHPHGGRHHHSPRGRAFPGMGPGMGFEGFGMHPFMMGGPRGRGGFGARGGRGGMPPHAHGPPPFGPFATEGLPGFGEGMGHSTPFQLGPRGVEGFGRGRGMHGFGFGRGGPQAPFGFGGAGGHHHHHDHRHHHFGPFGSYHGGHDGRHHAHGPHHQHFEREASSVPAV